MYNYNKCFKNYNLKRFLLEVVFTLVMASLLTAIGGIQWTNSTATLFMQCVYITPRAIHTECLPHHYPSFHLNSNYRCVIYLPPLVFSQWDTVAINFSRSCSENWRRESEKWLQKEAFFTLNQSWQAASAPGKLLEMQIPGPEPCLLESEAGEWSSGNFMHTELWEALLTSFQNSLRCCLADNWVSGIHGEGLSLFTFLYYLNIFSHTSYYFNRNKNNT